MAKDYVVVSWRQMKGSAAEKRTFHLPTCPSLKKRAGFGGHADAQMPRAVAVELRYKPCERCQP